LNTQKTFLDPRGQQSTALLLLFLPKNKKEDYLRGFRTEGSEIECRFFRIKLPAECQRQHLSTGPKSSQAEQNIFPAFNGG
jgi:hypothetical protein